MSCNICHTPILVHPYFLDPTDLDSITQTDHLDPIVSTIFPRDPRGPASQNGTYYEKVTMLSRQHEGVVLQKVNHAGRGLFLSSQFQILGGVAMALWQEQLEDGHTIDCQHVMHEGCLKILCSVLGVPCDLSNLDTLVAILEQHEFLGITKYGGYSGIDYSEGELNKRWLTQPNNVDDGNIFDFRFENGKHDWTLQRPDVFPRLVSDITRTRMQICARSARQTDFLISCPHLVFMNIARFLDLPSLYKLTALSKRLRFTCLISTDFQSLVRNALFKTWACPTPAEEQDHLNNEMLITHLNKAKNITSIDGYPKRKAMGDWLLYGTEVFKSPNMRNRRRIFHLLSQMRQKYIHNAQQFGYLKLPSGESQFPCYSSERQLKVNFRAMVEHQLVLGSIGTGIPGTSKRYSLFIEVMEIFNMAYQPLVGASGMSEAVERAKARIKEEEEKVRKRGLGYASEHLSDQMERRIQKVIQDKMVLIFNENQWKKITFMMAVNG